MASTLSNFLSQTGYTVLNHYLVKQLGLKEAVVLCYLVTRYRNFKDKNMLVDNEAFYCKKEEISDWCGVPDRTQTNIFKKLSELNFIKHFDKGIPMKRYYILNLNVIEEYINYDKQEIIDMKRVKQVRNIKTKNLANNTVSAMS